MKQEQMPGPDLEEVRRRFEDWRQTRKRGCKIPEDLWLEAVKLAEVYSLSQICQSLRVEFNHLKKRIESHKALSLSCTPSAPRFIEMGVSQRASESECAIEVQRSDGTRMRMSMRGALDPQLIEMARAFWSRS
jgi:hypothetical protein